MRRPLLLLCVVCGLLSAMTIARAQSSPQLPDDPAASDKLFATIFPVFASPRCANCHGVVKNYPDHPHSVTPETHPGGAVGAGMPSPEVECSDCHDQPKDEKGEAAWKFTAPANMEWAGLAEEQVCAMEAAEVRIRDAEAGGEGGNIKGSYLYHLATDQLIQSAWLGHAGGAHTVDDQKRPLPLLPSPPLPYKEFLNAAADWVHAGAPCRATGHVSQVEEQKTAYMFHPAPNQTVSFEQSAKRTVNILRFRDGKATATVTASGIDETVTTVNTGSCEIVTRLRNEWARIGPPQIDATLDVTVKPDEYTIHFSLPPETTHTRTTTVQTNSCGVPEPPIPESGINLEWEPWIQTLRCPTAFPKKDGSMGCRPYEPHDMGAADGALHQTVKDESDAADRRSWLYASPMAIARIDTGEGLPVHVSVIWGLRLDQK